MWEVEVMRFPKAQEPEDGEKHKKHFEKREVVSYMNDRTTSPQP